MLEVRHDSERGRSEIGWLSSRHSFSFADYFDPAQMGFRALRVINEDVVQPGGGFGTHPHRNMEILSYVVRGALEHRDSTGNGSVIRPGDVQRMSAGTGVLHSEFNASDSEVVHFLQIWLLPERQGLEPSYAQGRFSEEERADSLRLVASRDGREGSLTVHQDVDVFAARLAPGKRVEYALQSERHAWVQVVGGDIDLNGTRLGAGDGAALGAEPALAFTARALSEFLVFDLA
jgi:redox-sensitive bicupin YhaK (pirin superfamily)